MPKHPDAALESRREFVAQIIETSRLLRNFIEQRAKQAGTTRAQWVVLWRLREREGLSQVDLSEALELKPISLVRLLDRLVGQGWVERRQDPRDRRVNRLYLTAAGRRAVDDLDELSRTVITDIAGELSLDAIGGSIAALRQVKCRLKAKPSAPARGNAKVAASGSRSARHLDSAGDPRIP